MVMGKLDSYMQKNETGPLSYTIHKHKLEMEKNINVRPSTIKIPEENIASNFSDIGHNDIFLDMPPEARETKAKINYWDYIRIKAFCTVKETINKLKRHL